MTADRQLIPLVDPGAAPAEVAGEIDAGYPRKDLDAYGDAGAIITNSAELAHTARLLCDHRSERRYTHVKATR